MNECDYSYYTARAKRREIIVVGIGIGGGG